MVVVFFWVSGVFGGFCVSFRALGNNEMTIMAGISSILFITMSVVWVKLQ